MPDLSDQYLTEIQSNRISGLDAGSRSIFPHYHGLCISNLPASICRWLGVPAMGGAALPQTPFSHLKSAYRKVILLLVDGLRLDAFRRLQQTEPWKDWASESVLLPLTSICPSTTSAVLTSLWTGVNPARHGILGYEMWLKEYGLIANMIFHSPASSNQAGSLANNGFNPESFLPVPVLGPHLKDHGVRVLALQPAAISRSGLSTMLLNGAQMVPYRTMSDMWVSLAEVLDSQPQVTYTYVYWGDLDELQHRYGPDDERVRLELASFARGLQWFIERARQRSGGDTLLLLSSDHGQISTPPASQYELRQHPELLADLVMPPSGENRLPYFFLRPGREAHARAYIEHAWPGEFMLLPAVQALRAGLFGAGSPYERVAERLGDWVLAAQGSAYLWWANKDNSLRGRHGGLSADEMLVPLYALEL